MRKRPSLAFCVSGQLRLYRLAEKSFFLLLTALAKLYDVHVFFYISLESTVANWKQGEEKRLMEALLGRFQMDEAGFRDSLDRIAAIRGVVIVQNHPRILSKHENIYLQVHRMRQHCGDMVMQAEITRGISFNRIILTRPDMYYYPEAITKIVHAIAYLKPNCFLNHWDQFLVLPRLLLPPFQTTSLTLEEFLANTLWVNNHYPTHDNVFADHHHFLAGLCEFTPIFPAFPIMCLCRACPTNDLAIQLARKDFQVSIV